MIYPTNFISITQGYHEGYHLDFGWCSHHNQPIRAIADGYVLKIEKQKNGGNVLYIKHNNNMVSSYAHLQSINVKGNEKVSLGQNVAIMGKTGTSATGEHLDLALYSNEKKALSYQKSDVKLFDYIEVYPDQSVRDDTLKKYSKYIKFYNPTPTTWTKGTYQFLKEKAIRKQPHLGNNIKKIKECIAERWDDSAYAKITPLNKPNADAYVKTGKDFEIEEIIDENGRIWGRWGKTGNDYMVICNIDGTPQAIKK